MGTLFGRTTTHSYYGLLLFFSCLHYVKKNFFPLDQGAGGGGREGGRWWEGGKVVTTGSCTGSYGCKLVELNSKTFLVPFLTLGRSVGLGGGLVSCLTAIMQEEIVKL